MAYITLCFFVILEDRNRLAVMTVPLILLLIVVNPDVEATMGTGHQNFLAVEAIMEMTENPFSIYEEKALRPKWARGNSTYTSGFI